MVNEAEPKPDDDSATHNKTASNPTRSAKPIRDRNLDAYQAAIVRMNNRRRFNGSLIERPKQ